MSDRNHLIYIQYNTSNNTYSISKTTYDDYYKDFFIIFEMVTEPYSIRISTDIVFMYPNIKSDTIIDKITNIIHAIEEGVL